MIIRTTYRSGRYCEYKNKLYRYITGDLRPILHPVLSKTPRPRGTMYIISYDRNDLSDGFICEESERYMQKYGFSCIKPVPRSEITRLFEIETYAIYKGIRFIYDGYRAEDGLVQIVTTRAYRYNCEEDQEFVRQLKEIGFQTHMEERNYCDYCKYVPESELEIYEEQTEIDISKL